jgi:uncharacterized protein associated with vWA-MoxR-VMAP ternary system/HD domain-containing protein
MDRLTDAGSGPLCFGVSHGAGPQTVRVAFDPSPTGQPDIALNGAPDGSTVHLERSASASATAALITLPAAPPDQDDDELRFELEAQSSVEIRRYPIVVRRTRCAISTALVSRETDAAPLPAQMRAALLWYSWRRYSEVIALKRFTSGKSGSQVLVFRPKLREPVFDNPKVAQSYVPGVIGSAWGSYLLVKTGPHHKVCEEWDRFETFLRDRLHPFMARSEAFLTTRTVDTGDTPLHDATLIGSFLGGELMQAEPFETLAQGTSNVERCETILARLFSVMATWYGGSDVRPLRDWKDLFDFDADGRLRLFGKFDLTARADRDRFAGALAWDVAFVKEAHLSDHLIGRHHDGLLHRIAGLDARYSLVHGDLHPRNILADRDDVWLLDFGEAGVAPTLVDFAKLEVYLRMWCLRLSADVQNFEDAAFAFENHMLDHMTASEGSLEPVCALADGLGATPSALLKIAHCIADIRRHALRYSLGSPDRRDYLAVLYLTVLRTVRYAGSSPELAYNFRLLITLSWILDDVLSRVVGIEPFERDQVRLDPRLLVDRQLVAAPGAPGRVVYLMGRRDGQMALAPLSATRGVLQSLQHHLDVYDHTLLVLAYVEALIDDPVAGFCDPGALAARTRQALGAQGIALGGLQTERSEPPPSLGHLTDALDDVRALLARALGGESWLLLKWVALFHDVGKPATRGMTRGRSKREKTQFLGHEVYGMQLVADHLDRLFPEPEQRVVMDQLIRWHHTHHSVVARYLEAPRLAAINQALTTLELPADEDRFLTPYLDAEAGARAPLFPLLMLHGFADTLACRGTGSGPVAPVAEIDLTLLALYARYPKIRSRKDLSARFKEMTRGLDAAIAVTGPPLGRLSRELRAWFMSECAAATIPTREQVIAKAAEIRDANT